jgi:hypothetical protein
MTQFHDHHHHKRQGFDLSARSVSGFTVALAKVFRSPYFFSFLVDCIGVTLKGFSCVTFFAFIYHAQYAFSL